MNVQVVPAGSLGPSELARWSDLQRATPLYRSPFFRPEFTRAVAEVRDVRVAVIEDGGAIAGFFPFEVGRRRRGRPVGWPFSDFHGIVLDAAVAIDPRELVRACGLTVWSFDHLPAGLTAFAPYVDRHAGSPYLDLSEGYDAYLQGRWPHQKIRDTLRRARKLGRDVGPLRFVPECDDPDLFARVIEWKRHQYAATGVRDILADAGSRELLRTMHRTRGDEFAGALSVLYAGDVVAGLDFGIRSRSVWYPWFPAYNLELSRYSPGLVLLLELARAVPALGIVEIGLGKGEAPYKQVLATGSETVHEGCVGARAFSALPVKVRGSARRGLQRVGVHRAARRALRRVRGAASRG